MGLGHAELFRLLPRAIGDRAWRVHRDLITITAQGQQLSIKLLPEGRRNLGALKLPVTDRAGIFFPRVHVRTGR